MSKQIEAMKLAAEFNRYFTSTNGVDVPERVSVPRDEWRTLFAAIRRAEQPAQQEPATKDVVIDNMGKPFTVKAYVDPQPAQHSTARFQ